MGGTAPFLSTNHIARLVSFQFPLVLLPESINFLSQSSMCKVDNVFPEDNIPLHLPEDSVFSQRINVHFSVDRLCYFPKTYFILFIEKSIYVKNVFENVW